MKPTLSLKANYGNVRTFKLRLNNPHMQHSFQVVISTNSVASYVAFMYVDLEAINQISETLAPDSETQAFVIGFNAGDRQRFTSITADSTQVIYRVDGKLIS